MAYGDDEYEPLPGVTTRPSQYPQQPWLPPPVPTDPIWPTSNQPGTEKFVDYRGWDTPYYPPQPVQDPVQAAIAPAPNTQYGTVLPYAQDTQTGEYRWAMPSIARDFIQGRYDMTQGPRTGTMTPEATMSLTPSALGTSMGGQAGSTALRTFGGPFSQTADIHALIEARKMAATGVIDPARIWRETGWWHAPDGRWKNEISDHQMAYYPQFTGATAGVPSWTPITGGPGSPVYPGTSTTWGQLVNHPDLEMAYPQLANMKLNYGSLPPGYAAAYSRKGPVGTPGQIALGHEVPGYNVMGHETMHAIQDIERFPRGGNTSIPDIVFDPALEPAFRHYYDNAQSELLKPMSYKDWLSYRENAGFGKPDPKSPINKSFYNSYIQNLPTHIDPQSAEGQWIMGNGAEHVYERISGEAEARLVERRLGMTPQQRLDRPPWMDWDIQPHEQLFRDPLP